MLATSQRVPIPVSGYPVRDPFAQMPWTVTTEGDLPDENEHREHDTSATAQSDYWGRILEIGDPRLLSRWPGGRRVRPELGAQATPRR